MLSCLLITYLIGNYQADACICNMTHIFLHLLVVAISILVSSSVRWDADTLGDESQCSGIFRPSQRELSRKDQQDPLVVWVGNPSSALHLDGKHGPIPIPTIWGRFVNILYVTQCSTAPSLDHHSSNHDDTVTVFVQYLKEWQLEHLHLQGRPLFLAGNALDSGIGRKVLLIAKRLVIHKAKVAGVAVANVAYTPTQKFFGHRSFETGNSMTFWTIDRAKQNIVCNGWFSKVEFQMYDIRLTYSPTTSMYAANNHPSPAEPVHSVEYQLSTISTYDACYNAYHFPSFKAFERDWTAADMTPVQQLPTTSNLSTAGTLPALPLSKKRLCKVGNDHLFEPWMSEPAEAFVACNETAESCADSSTEHRCLIEWLLQAGVTVLGYSMLYSSSRATCSFYIGIYEADAVTYSDPSQLDNGHFHHQGPSNTSNESCPGSIEQVNRGVETPDDLPSLHRAYSKFNAASLQPMDASWQDGRHLAHMQDSGSSCSIDFVNHADDSTEDFDSAERQSSGLSRLTPAPTFVPAHLVWIQFDGLLSVTPGSTNSGSGSRRRSSGKQGGTTGGKLMLGRAAAVDILARLVQGYSEVDYIDLLVP